MTFRTRDIATTFAAGVNISTFLRDYVDELVTTAGMARSAAIDYASETGVEDGTRVPPGLKYTAGTLRIGTGDDDTVTPGQQNAIDNAIASQTGNDFQSMTIADLPATATPGTTFYVSDGLRDQPTQGTGCLVYYGDIWRYVRDDDPVIPPS